MFKKKKGNYVVCRGCSELFGRVVKRRVSHGLASSFIDNCQNCREGGIELYRGGKDND